MDNPILTTKILYLIAITYGIGEQEVKDAYNEVYSFDVILNCAMESKRTNRDFKTIVKDNLNGK